jgi:transposase
MFGKVRRMYFRDQLSIKEIVRRTSLSRNTVKKWVQAPPGSEPSYRRAAVKSRLAPFEAQLHAALTADAQRPRRDRRSVLRLYQELRDAGFTGGYSTVTEYVRGWRAQRGERLARTGYVPLKFVAGEAFQFDWSEESLVVGGIYRRLQVAHLKLCASRAFWLVAYPTQSHEMLFDAHTRAFTALGGVPKRGIYDNMKTAVDRVQKGKARIVNARFAALCAHYLFDPDFCNVASGWEKGVVEKNVQDSRRRIWRDAEQHDFRTLSELNAWLETRCRALWSELRHPEAPTITVAEALEHEQTQLMPMPMAFDGYVESVARVSSTCLVSVQRNRYSVPCELAGQRVSVRLYPAHIEVVADETVVARHARLFDRDQTCYDWQHYIALLARKPGVLRNGAPFAEMPDALVQLHRVLRKREGGDRAMAQVLSAVPRYGLEAVLVAVELVLESGATSAEHVLNVLARLTQGSMPEPIETALQLQEVPTTDTGRYDHLHREVDHA